MINDELARLLSLATQLHQQKKWDDCIAPFTAYISLQDDPHGQSVAYLNRGIAYGSKGEHDRAIADFDKVLSLKPKNANAYLNRGVAYAHKGKYDRAIADYDKALDLNINNASAYLNRGVAYVNKGEYGLGFTNILRAVEEGKRFKSLHPMAYLAAQIKDIFEDDEKGVESFKLFAFLYAAIAKIKEVRLSKPIEGKEVAHYTSLHTLKKLVDEETSIKKEECFRLYNADYMNDPEEGRIFFDIMNQEKYGIDVESLFYSNNKEAPHPSSAYIGSFVIVDLAEASAKDKKQVKDKLFLWRTYGKHDQEEAAGACLIFKHEETHFAKHPPFEIGAMSQLLDTEAISRKQPSKPALYKIAYLSNCKKEDEEENELADALDELVEPLIDIRRFCDGSEDNQKNALAKLVRELLDDIRFLFKADHYREEGEVRVVQMNYSETEQTDIKIDMEQFPPRLYLKTLKGCRFPEVILGPRVRGESEWKSWLKECRVEKVSQSGIPYRTQ